MINVNNGVNYKIAIYDDDVNYVEYIKNLVCECSMGKLEFFICNPGGRLLWDSEVVHDALFINTQLDGVDGTETARKLGVRNRNAVLVFCSGVVSPTPESIKVTPCRFPLKQLGDKTMCWEVTETLEKMVRSCGEEHILTRTEEGLARIYADGIAYTPRARRGSSIHLLEPEKYEVKDELLTNLHVSVLYEQLHKCGFEFTHNSYLAGYRWVMRLDETYLALGGGRELNIFRSHHNGFKKGFIKFWDKCGGGDDVD